MSNTIELMLSVDRTMLRCILCGILWYVRAYQYVITASESSKKRKRLHFKIRIRSRWTKVVLIEAGSQIQARSLIEAGRGSDGIVLIQAGGFY